MAHIWNRRSQGEVAFSTTRYEYATISDEKNKEVLESLRALGALLDDMKELQTTMTCLQTEVKIMSTAMARRYNQLRKDKYMKNMNQIVKCVQRLFETYPEANLKSMREETSLLFPDEEEDVYFPARQMFEHLLIKLLGIAHLFSQTIKYCVEANRHILQQMNGALFIHVMVVFSAAVSRIWAVSGTGLKQTVKWYKSLRAHVPSLHSTPIKIVESISLLPEDIDQLLSEYEMMLKREDTRSEVLLKYCGAPNSEDSDVIEAREANEGKDSKCWTGDTLLHNSVESIDIGVPMQRHESSKHPALVMDLGEPVERIDFVNPNLEKVSYSEECSNQWSSDEMETDSNDLHGVSSKECVSLKLRLRLQKLKKMQRKSKLQLKQLKNRAVESDTKDHQNQKRAKKKQLMKIERKIASLENEISHASMSTDPSSGLNTTHVEVVKPPKDTFNDYERHIKSAKKKKLGKNSNPESLQESSAHTESPRLESGECSKKVKKKKGKGGNAETKVASETSNAHNDSTDQVLRTIPSVKDTKKNKKKKKKVLVGDDSARKLENIQIDRLVNKGKHKQKKVRNKEKVKKLKNQSLVSR